VCVCMEANREKTSHSPHPPTRKASILGSTYAFLYTKNKIKHRASKRMEVHTAGKWVTSSA
jgi:hypothetical protein